MVINFAEHDRQWREHLAELSRRRHEFSRGNQPEKGRPMTNVTADIERRYNKNRLRTRLRDAAAMLHESMKSADGAKDGFGEGSPQHKKEMDGYAARRDELDAIVREARDAGEDPRALLAGDVLAFSRGGPFTERGLWTVMGLSRPEDFNQPGTSTKGSIMQTDLQSKLDAAQQRQQELREKYDAAALSADSAGLAHLREQLTQANVSAAEAQFELSAAENRDPQPTGPRQHQQYTAEQEQALINAGKAEATKYVEDSVRRQERIRDSAAPAPQGGFVMTPNGAVPYFGKL